MRSRLVGFNLLTIFCFGIVSCSDKYQEIADLRPDALPEGSGDTGAVSDTSFDQCGTAVDTTAVQRFPADIVIVVDNSGGMEEEVVMVQDNMNGFFWQIAAAGVDPHVVLISDDSDDSRGICIAAPLGSGSCPDDSNPSANYLHSTRSVTSHVALDRIIDTYDHNTYGWNHMLRREAIIHFIVVTDDDSSLSMDEFIEDLSVLEPPLTDFVFHAIVAIEDDIEGGPCEDIAEDEGVVYKSLVAATGGVLGNLCEQQFQPVFTKLAERIGAASMQCEWDIPSPPDGEVFDPQKVNVEFTDSGGTAHQIGQVDSASSCTSVEHGWYYDRPDDPSKILVCDQTCDWLRGHLGAEVTIILGCETLKAELVV